MAKPRPTSFDYLVMALNPALVILLVGSLVFFLIEVFYQGEYQERLYFVMACFTIATVGITRIAIEEDAARASVYGLALSGAMLFVTPYLARIPIPLLILLLAVIWYSAHRLTWDCTLIDDEQDASGEGLLQRIGLDESPTGEQVDPNAPKPPLWKHILSPDRSKHAPGLTIVYFSLAALPIFGVLQGFIPSSAVENRTRAFYYLITYVGSGLGLLLTTSLLGLRRYLRQRNVAMPADMTTAWVGVGATLIFLVLIIATILPRSARELQLGQSPIKFTSHDLNATRGGWGNEGGKGEQEGNARNRDVQNPQGAPGNQNGRGDQPGGHQGEKGQGGDKQGAGQQGSGQQQGQGQNAPQSGGDAPRPDANDQSNANGQQQQSEESAQRGQDPRRQGEQGKQGNRPQQNQNANKPQNRGDARQPNRAPQQPPPERQNEDRTNDDSKTPTNSQQTSSPRPQVKIDFNPAATIPFLGWLLKLLAVILIVGTLLYLAIRYWRQFLAALRQMLADLANFFRMLFGGKSVDVAEAATAAVAVRYPRFSELTNPFRRGGANRNPRELVQETYVALEAWARDHGFPREKGQTAFEFADALAAQVTEIAKESKWLADCYSRAAFSSDDIPTQIAGSLAAIWQRLEQLYGRVPPPSPVIPPPPPGSV